MMDDDGMKEVMDTISVATGVGALAGILPALAALVTIVWTGIRIWETDTVQHLRGKSK
jgi:glycerol-3-phosphate acyltransferase PlsY|tara:strand:+ start:1357 stop:1530 length:174 start_codon:yes stop_codon:yes gene_type:complete